MRADIGTEVTLDTVVWIPLRNIDSDTALLVCRGTGWCGTVYVIYECGYRQVVSFLSVYSSLNCVDKLHNVLTSGLCVCHIETLVLAVLPALWYLNLNYMLSTCVDSSPVLHNNVLTLAAVGCLCSSLHKLVCLVSRDDVSQLEECRLKDCVDTCRAHACLDT